MVEIADLESRVEEMQAVFHKPFNDGFIAFGKEKVYIVRDKEEFEFEEINRSQIHSVLVSETEGYNPQERYECRDAAEKETEDEKDYTEIQISLKTKSVCTTVENCPKSVTRTLLETDIDF